LSSSSAAVRRRLPPPSAIIVDARRRHPCAARCRSPRPPPTSPLVEAHLQLHSPKVDVEGKEEVVLAQGDAEVGTAPPSPRPSRQLPEEGGIILNREVLRPGGGGAGGGGQAVDGAPCATNSGVKGRRAATTVCRRRRLLGIPVPAGPKPPSPLPPMPTPTPTPTPPPHDNDDNDGGRSPPPPLLPLGGRTRGDEWQPGGRGRAQGFEIQREEGHGATSRRRR
jgi:hypothetical protein